MTQIIEHPDGRIMVAETAGGSGGGATSTATRPALWEEVRDHLARAAQAAEAAFDAAKTRLAAHMETVPGSSAPPVAAEPSPEPDPPPVLERAGGARAAR